MQIRDRLMSILRENPIIPGIKDDDDFHQVLTLPSKVVFVLYGSVLSIQQIIARLKQAGKIVLVNTDLIDGFASRDIVVRYFKENTQADGILSSKAAMIKAARALGMLTIHRVFVIDSFSYRNLARQVELSKPDYVELMPGCMPKVISWAIQDIHIPLIAGGMICEREEAEAALNAGAKAVSSTNRTVWSLRLPSPGSVIRARKTPRVLLDRTTAASDQAV